MVRVAVLGLSLIVVAIDAARAQDIAGIEDCTKTSGLDKRTGCLQSNVNFLQRLVTRIALEAGQRLSAADAETSDFTARALARAAPQLPGVTVLGPAPAPLAVLRGRHRRRFLVKAAREVRLQAVLRDWLARVRTAGSARIQIDIDPYSFL